MGNQSLCRIQTNNTAPSRCQIDLGLYRMCIVLPKRAFYTGLDSGGNEQTFEEWITAGIHAANPIQRFYPMPEIRNVEDTSEDNSEFTDGYGNTTVMAEGVFGFTQDFNPDNCLNKRLLAFNRQEFRVIIIDNENNAQVVRTAEGITGELSSIWVSQPKANTYGELSLPTIAYKFRNPAEHKLREVMPIDLSWNELQGLEDISLDAIKSGSDIKITFSVGCGGDDVTSELSALSGETSAWRVQTGTADPVEISTAPTYDYASNAFILSGPVSYTKIGLVNPALLYELGISGKDCADMTTIS